MPTTEVEERNFKSLDWLRNGIRYLLEVIAALSVLLLTLGLVSASWNFLDKDQLFGNSPWLQSLWGLDQALAIDANLPLVFVLLWASWKRGDWVKVGIYSVIGGMLLFVAAIILDMEELRQALNITFGDAAAQVHVSIGVLTQVRSIATIGLVAMSGLTWTTLLVKKSKKPDEAPKVPADPGPVTPQETEPVQPPEKPSKNGHTPVEDKYQRYLEIIAITPTKKATIPYMAKALGVSPSTISNYRKKMRKEKENGHTHDELEIFQPDTTFEEAYS